MSGMVTAIEIEKMYGVPAGVARSAIKRFQIRNQKTDGRISIAIQDAEPIIFDYHARQDSYTLFNQWNLLSDQGRGRCDEPFGALPYQKI